MNQTMPQVPGRSHREALASSAMSEEAKRLQ